LSAALFAAYNFNLYVGVTNDLTGERSDRRMV
jgi:hypothetical protein